MTADDLIVPTATTCTDQFGHFAITWRDADGEQLVSFPYVPTPADELRVSSLYSDQLVGIHGLWPYLMSAGGFRLSAHFEYRYTGGQQATSLFCHTDQERWYVQAVLQHVQLAMSMSSEMGGSLTGEWPPKSVRCAPFGGHLHLSGRALIINMFTTDSDLQSEVAKYELIGISGTHQDLIHEDPASIQYDVVSIEVSGTQVDLTMIARSDRVTVYPVFATLKNDPHHPQTAKMWESQSPYGIHDFTRLLITRSNGLQIRPTPAARLAPPFLGQRYHSVTGDVARRGTWAVMATRYLSFSEPASMGAQFMW